MYNENTVNINDITPDKSLQIYNYLGKNGIQYVYFLPYGANPQKFYEEAIAVRSRKKNDDGRRSTQGNHGKYNPEGKIYKPGQFQPIGNTKYFTFYQRQIMAQDQTVDIYLHLGGGNK